MKMIKSPYVFSVNTPVSGNYPQCLYKYPYKVESLAPDDFSQTIEWFPPVNKVFTENTRYTALFTLEPADGYSFDGIKIDDIKGLPKQDTEDISINIDRRNLVIKVSFKETAGEKAAAKLLFYDDFSGDSIDTKKWDLCPEMDRQGRSSWRDDMVSVNGGLLHLKFARDRELGKSKTNDETFAENWLRAGGIRTQTKEGRLLFFNSFGYYESRIKFPVVSGTWGAFWLMSPTQRFIMENGRNGTEIDIVETIKNHLGSYNSALHWNGYGEKHKFVGSKTRKDDNPRPDINIFDGDFHVFALDWSPSEYLFYIDGKLFWRVDGGEFFSNSGINQNPNYIKLTTEGAVYSGDLPLDFTESEMLVDYVKVYNQPK